MAGCRSCNICRPWRCLCGIERCSWFDDGPCPRCGEDLRACGRRERTWWWRRLQWLRSLPWRLRPARQWRWARYRVRRALCLADGGPSS